MFESNVAVGLKRHGLCFHVIIVEAVVMTFVTHWTVFFSLLYDFLFSFISGGADFPCTRKLFLFVE